jgi:hypothetical protein
MILSPSNIFKKQLLQQGIYYLQAFIEQVMGSGDYLAGNCKRGEISWLFFTKVNR